MTKKVTGFSKWCVGKRLTNKRKSYAGYLEAKNKIGLAIHYPTTMRGFAIYQQNWDKGEDGFGGEVVGKRKLEK
ncbi:12281_t:CDS:2 [Funneliformis geosporum]|uniref:19829_t:CDS:1 n=1 Tax=Funneliformis geosporum TaxID=1117311 RepID=A0A9W4SB73_9GLOM|nr:12281_t:CDS:2 [Funneliformis geosporum]CAI2163445.1 19829_t:CDS:2 [Funneliformis geosporum]